MNANGSLPKGGSYPADQNSDGTWNLRGVPTFAAHRRFGRSFGRSWLEKAVAKAAESHQAGYIAPLHVAHHGTGEDVLEAGHFLPTGVAEMVYEGRTVPVIVSDLLSVPEEVYQRIRAGKLPYLSVEIGDLARPEITSLALLAHSAPFFKFPLLTVGEEQPQEAQRLVASAPVLAYSASRSLFRFDGGTVKKTAKKPVRYEADASALVADALGKAVEQIKAKISEALDAALSEFELVAPKQEGEEEEEEELEPEVEEETPEGNGDEDDLAPAEAPAPAMAAQAQPLRRRSQPAVAAYSAGAAANAAMAGRLAALEAKTAAAEKRVSEETEVAAAAEELRHYSVADVAKELRKQFKAGGKAAVRAYVDAVKTYGVMAPPESWTGEIPAGASEPVEVTVYAAAGAAQAKEARRLHSIYQQSPAFVRQTPLDAYLAAQLGPAPHPKPNTSSAPAPGGR